MNIAIEDNKITMDNEAQEMLEKCYGINDELRLLTKHLCENIDCGEVAYCKTCPFGVIRGAANGIAQIIMRAVKNKDDYDLTKVKADIAQTTFYEGEKYFT